MMKQCFWPWKSGCSLCGVDSWAKFGYYEISQTSVSFLVWMRNISLMGPDTWSSAEQGMKYLPSLFRWERRTLIKISYLHFHPSTSFPVCAMFSDCSKNSCLRGMNCEEASTICVLNFPLTGMAGKSLNTFFWTGQAVQFCFYKEAASHREKHISEATCITALTRVAPSAPTQKSWIDKVVNADFIYLNLWP